MLAILIHRFSWLYGSFWNDLALVFMNDTGTLRPGDLAQACLYSWMPCKSVPDQITVSSAVKECHMLSLDLSVAQFGFIYSYVKSRFNCSLILALATTYTPAIWVAPSTYSSLHHCVYLGMADLLVAPIFASPLLPTNQAAGMPPCSNGNHYKSAEDSTFTGSNQIQGNLTAYDVGNQILTTNPDSNNGDANGRRRCDSLFGSSASTEDVEESQPVDGLPLEPQDKVVRNWLFGIASEAAGTDVELRGSQFEGSLFACDDTTEPGPETDFLFDAMKDESAEALTPPCHSPDAQMSAHLQPNQDLSACQGGLDVSSGGATTIDKQDSNSLYVFGDVPSDPQFSTYRSPRFASGGNTSTQLAHTTDNPSRNKAMYIAPSALYQTPQSTSHHRSITDGQFAIERGPGEFLQPFSRSLQLVRIPILNSKGEVISSSFIPASDPEDELSIPQTTAQVSAWLFDQQYESYFYQTMSSQDLDMQLSCYRQPSKTPSSSLPSHAALRPFDQSFDWSQDREMDTVFVAQSNAAGPMGQSGSGKSEPKAQHPQQQPSASVQYRCEWRENPCNMVIDSGSRQDVLYHLRQYHDIAGLVPVTKSSQVGTSTDARTGSKKSKILCLWNDCKAVLQFDNFYKHVAAKHLASLARACENCGKDLSRPDSLKRHKEKAKDGICPVQGKQKGRKVLQVDRSGFDGEGLSDERPQKRQRV